MVDPLRLRVGEYYDSGIQRWPGHELILTSEGCVLLVDCISPTPDEIDEFETADAHFAWIDARHNGILCYRFGATVKLFRPTVADGRVSRQEPPRR